METEVSLSLSLMPTTVPYPESHESNPHPSNIQPSVVTYSKQFTSLRLPTVRATQLNQLILTLIFLITSSCSNYEIPHCTYSTYDHISSSVTLFSRATSNFFLLYPLGTLRPLYRTGVSLLSRKSFYIFNQQIYFIIWYLLDRASLI